MSTVSTVSGGRTGASTDIHPLTELTPPIHEHYVTEPSSVITEAAAAAAEETAVNAIIADETTVNAIIADETTVVNAALADETTVRFVAEATDTATTAHLVHSASEIEDDLTTTFRNIFVGDSAVKEDVVDPPVLLSDHARDHVEYHGVEQVSTDLHDHLDSVVRSTLGPASGEQEDNRVTHDHVYTHSHSAGAPHDHPYYGDHHSYDDDAQNKIYNLMHSDTLLVILSLFLMIVLGLAFRKLCMKLTKGKNRKRRVRHGLRGIAEHMHHVTRSMSNDLELPDSPKAVMRTYSNYNRRPLRSTASNSSTTSTLASVTEENNNNDNSNHDAVKREATRDRLRIAVLEHNQSKENIMVEAIRSLEKAEVHEMKDLGRR